MFEHFLTDLLKIERASPDRHHEDIHGFAFLTLPAPFRPPSSPSISTPASPLPSSRDKPGLLFPAVTSPSDTAVRRKNNYLLI